MFRLGSKRVTSLARSASTASSEPLKQTPLAAFHISKGAKMVPFAGYNMPVQYEDGIIASHRHTREKASIFDVSHMIQLRIHGKDRVKFIEKLVVSNVAELKPSSGVLSFFSNEKGGIKDDLIIHNYADKALHIVANAGCADKDLAHLKSHLASFDGDAALEVLQDKALIALQGPKAAEALSKHTKFNFETFPFMNHQELLLDGKYKCLVTRCGYTGEDGFEISVANDSVVALTALLLENPDVHLAGLGARDSLRIEAGLNLYGQEINEDISPIAAGIAWCIGKRRREQGGFLGADKILADLKNGTPTKKVGLTTTGRPARTGAVLYDLQGAEIGYVTSGVPSPSLNNKNVSIGYVPTGVSALGTKLQVKVGAKLQPAEIIKMPFVPTKYHKVKA